MNILIVSDGVPMPDRRMMGLFAFDQAKALAKAGHNVCIAAVNLRSFRYKRPNGFSKAVRDGVTVYEYSLPVGAVPFSLYQWIGVKCLGYLYKKVLKDGIVPDIVHSHFYEMTGCAAKLKPKYGYNLIATEHFSMFLNKEHPERSKVLSRATEIYKNVDRVFAVSSALARVITDECNKPTGVLHNIVDVATFSNEKAKDKCDKIKFISVARLINSKNLSLLIDAFAEAHNKNKNISLEIYGSGEEESKLKNQIEERNMADVIKLCGFADRSVLAGAISKADCFILLSDFETFGVVYIEALATGTPVIATRCGGPEDFVTDENGILVDCKDKVQAAQAILKMCREYDKYDAKAISENTKKCFSPQIIAEKLEQQYKEVLESRK